MDCELYLLLIQWLSTNVYRCTRPQATVTNQHTVLSLGSKETHIQSHYHCYVTETFFVELCYIRYRQPPDAIQAVREETTANPVNASSRASPSYSSNRHHCIIRHKHACPQRHCWLNFIHRHTCSHVTTALQRTRPP